MRGTVSHPTTSIQQGSLPPPIVARLLFRTSNFGQKEMFDVLELIDVRG